MVQATREMHMQRFAAAARQLMEGDMAAAAEGRFSKTVFMASGSADQVGETCGIEATGDCGLGLVSLRFRHGDMGAPRRATVALAHEDARLVVRDCVLWLDADGDRAVLVPRDARRFCHFAIGAGGLERRAGRPASALGAGMSRARERLERIARELRQEDMRHVVHVRTMPLAA